MREKIQAHSINHNDRLPYGAVPLDPWRATHVSGVSAWHNYYVNGSNIRIERRLQQAMINDDWFKREPLAHDLHDLMRTSLRDSQNRRVEMNGRTRMPQEIIDTDERARHALDGTATPGELFTLLVDTPELGSLELAKLSHPFDFEAPREMQREVDELLLQSGGELLDSQPRYKVKRSDSTIPAAILLRKQDLMDFPVDDDGALVRVVERQGFLIYPGDGMRDNAHFARLFRNPANHTALFAMTENYLVGHDKPTYGWVQPQATSYYAKYITA